MDDDELVNKVAKAIAKQSGFTTAPGVKPYFKHASAALQVVKEAGWKGPEKPVAPTVEHITGVALKEPKHGTLWICEKPKRHDDVFALMHRGGTNPHNTSPHDCQQGFYTSAQRFVTRLEAMPIAKAAGQLIRPATGGYQGPELFSEDLW